jgi:hypothetical protein
MIWRNRTKALGKHDLGLGRSIVVRWEGDAYIDVGTSKGTAQGEIGRCKDHKLSPELPPRYAAVYVSISRELLSV